MLYLTKTILHHYIILTPHLVIMKRIGIIIPAKLDDARVCSGIGTSGKAINGKNGTSANGNGVGGSGD